MKQKRYKVIVFGVITLLIAAYIFVEAPNLNPFFFSDGALFWAAVITIFADEIAALGMAHREKKTGLKPEENLSLLRVISRQYMLKHTPSVQFPPQSSLL